MTVLHIMKATGIAGAERHLLSLLPALRARGVDARMLLLVEKDRPQDEYLALLREQNVPTERRVMRRHADPQLLPWLVNEFRRERPALIHAHLSHAQLYAIPSARMAGIPIITGHHNDDPFVRRAPFRQIFRRLWGMTDGGIAISQAVADFCREIEGPSADRLRVIHYGMEAPPLHDHPPLRARYRAELGLSEDAVIIGSVGRLTEQKGITYALQAFARLRPQHPHAHLLLLGDGELRSVLEAEAASLGLGDAVRFLGWRGDAASWMHALDIFLFPSLWEGFGLVLLEAMAAQLPVIGSRVSGIPEIVIDGETGLLVEPRAVEPLTAALDQLVRDRPLCRHMGLLGRSRLETDFSIERMTAHTLAVYGPWMG